MRGDVNLSKIFRDLTVLNELGGKESLALKFSDPDGVHTGKSGWSFGLCQFDIANNGMAALCLYECGFSVAEVTSLKNQTFKDMASANKRLAAHATIIAKWGERQLSDCLNRARELANLAGWTYADDRALLYAADYHNQMYLSKGGSFFMWAKGKKTISDYDIYKFRINQPWGQKRPDDVKRRYANLLKVCHDSGV